MLVHNLYTIGTQGKPACGNRANTVKSGYMGARFW